jgi:hypothetical protein
MRHGLKTVLSEKAVSFLGILKNTKEDRALNLILIFAEGIDHG